MSWIVDGRPETVRRQVHEALADMGTETSELTYLRLVGDTPGAHQDVPLEEWLGALIELRDQGLIRRIGLSGASPRILARARRMTLAWLLRRSPAMVVIRARAAPITSGPTSQPPRSPDD
ncbi:aldo/keto reductase [Streptomyces malaysiensis]|uniref:aldo/keto reductase n=1 Tax=Streptomyces malaysiensis TaxID=92644 RepID=UPI003697AFF0